MSPSPAVDVSANAGCGAAHRGRNAPAVPVRPQPRPQQRRAAGCLTIMHSLVHVGGVICCKLSTVLVTCIRVLVALQWPLRKMQLAGLM